MRLSFSLNSAAFKTAAIAMAATSIAFAMPATAHDTGYVHQHQNSNNDQLLGAGIGAIAGGVLGSQLAGNGARTEGSVLGAVLGGVAGAAIVGDGNNNRGYSSHNGYYNGGTYNPQTGYYQGGQRVYYQQPRTSYGYATSYQQPVYPQTTYRTTYHYSAPVYQPVYNPYYRAPRSGISINIGTGGYYGNSGYRNHRTYSQPRHHHNQRRHNQRRRGH
ncbi:hypothetical protein GCM10011309_00500 [Litorimonas cladophorae]|uniref:17 kDa surface antigen n=1 Tax=Litorimonas cladophorae TaxID=1220491 RepID=A0A918NBG8_9PROT|nr:glycine zipper 2TM domain-containing protein [Litorimonas cladophorae]GGX55759.1 hypothetical protein GCM10011309_00500 [Litorimonas cladophorae]